MKNTPAYEKEKAGDFAITNNWNGIFIQKRDANAML